MIRRLLLSFALLCLLTACDGAAGGSVVSIGPIPTLPPTSPTPVVTPTPLASPTPTLVPAANLELSSVVADVNDVQEIFSRVTVAQNSYVLATADLTTLADATAKKDDFVAASDACVVGLDGAMQDLSKLYPPERARPYHNATYAFLLEYRAYVSDLRQGVSNNDPDLWNRGAGRWSQWTQLEQQRRAARTAIYDYIKAGER